jgi:hypothetical protein
MTASNVNIGDLVMVHGFHNGTVVDKFLSATGDEIIDIQTSRDRLAALEEHIVCNYGNRAPIELTCSIGGQLFAFEHTGIAPFEGQIELETNAHFQPLRDMFSGKIPQGEYYDLHVPVGVTLYQALPNRRRIRNLGSEENKRTRGALCLICSN